MKEQHSIKKINGHEIFFREVGEGRPILLIPPFPSPSLVFDPIIPTLAKNRKVIAFDLPGFAGKSKLDPDFVISVENYTNLIAQIIHRYGYSDNEYDLLGYSTGGFFLQNGIVKKILNPDKTIFISTSYKGRFIVWRNLEKIFLKLVTAVDKFSPLLTSLIGRLYLILVALVDFKNKKDSLKKNLSFKKTIKEYSTLNVSACLKLINS
ncbi:hypothetical protein GF357_00415 [Candidatus Dojkabacteria bacterium]|nr:hypothetical protein [Candidatus Dojkabacteria bacterium]